MQPKVSYRIRTQGKAKELRVEKNGDVIRSFKFFGYRDGGLVETIHDVAGIALQGDEVHSLIQKVLKLYSGQGEGYILRVWKGFPSAAKKKGFIFNERGACSQDELVKGLWVIRLVESFVDGFWLQVMTAVMGRCFQL